MTYVSLAAFLLLAIAMGCIWIACLGRINSNYFQGVEQICEIGYVFFPPLCLCIYIIRWFAWKRGWFEIEGTPEIGLVIAMPLCIFVIFVALARFSRWQRKRHIEKRHGKDIS